MRKPRVGMVGLGGIAQKAYLPILSKESDWEFVGAYTPNVEKRKRVCRQYRINDFSSLQALAEECDAIFVHSSTSSHFEVVSGLLQKGIDVFVDKPLAATISDSEKLVELSEKHNRKMMVGFNRRFAPMYVEAKRKAKQLDWVRFEKHRSNGIGPPTYQFTLLDDYIHVVDTVRWLAGADIKIRYKTMQLNRDNQLIHVGHIFESPNKTVLQTAMHRNAGSNLEQLELYTAGAIIRVKNMHTMEIEQDETLTSKNPPSWETILKQKGFEDAVRHFIHCVKNDEKLIVDGVEGLKTQILVGLISRSD